LQKAYKSGNITKENINKRGYNKFLEISGNVSVAINEAKIREDGKWNGLKGYITNTELSAKDVYEQYSGLWQVEKAFRVTKGTLELRPVFLFTEKRIEAHVCICFVACKVYKELERILRANAINLSVDKVLGIARTITTMKIRLPLSNETLTKTILLTARHKLIARLFDPDFGKILLRGSHCRSQETEGTFLFPVLQNISKRRQTVPHRKQPPLTGLSRPGMGLFDQLQVSSLKR
jgi:transposase